MRLQQSCSCKLHEVISTDASFAVCFVLSAASAEADLAGRVKAISPMFDRFLGEVGIEAEICVGGGNRRMLADWLRRRGWSIPERG